MGAACGNCFEEQTHHKPVVEMKRRHKSRKASTSSNQSDEKHLNNNNHILKSPALTAHDSHDQQQNQEQLINKLVNEVIERQSVFTQQKLSLNDFEKVSMLGEGGFAVVYQVRRKRPLTESRANETFAMKVISKKQLYERCVLDGLMFERMMMIKLDCRFAVKLFCSFQDKHSCYFVMEYAKGGDVYSFLINRKQNLKVEEYIKTGESGARMVMGCVVLAFERLQKENIVYRDLKPENVLIFENGYAKLADFGLAKIYKPGQIESVEAGTKIYFAPEMVEEDVYSIKGIDFWTLGIFLHQLLYRRPPFSSQYIQKGKFYDHCNQWQNEPKWPRNPFPVSDQAKDLIVKFLKAKAQDRLGYKRFADIKQHPFFSQFDWKMLENEEMGSPLKEIVERYPLEAINGVSKRHPAFNEESLPNIPGFSFACKITEKDKFI